MKMKPRTAKIVSLIFMLILSFNMVACGGKSSIGNMLGDNTTTVGTPNQSQGENKSSSLGTVEGAPQSGFGIFTYHNFRYEGNFENGKPNGRGVLYWLESDHAMQQVTGEWINGYADGEIEYIVISLNSPNIWTYVFSVENGRVPTAIAVQPLETSQAMDFTPDRLFGVPPWVEVRTNPNMEPPAGSGNYTEEIRFAIANQGREYALRLTLPNLQENIASGYYSDVDIWFNEGSISINLQEDEHNRIFISTQYSVVHFEDNDILLSFIMPPDKPMAWGANDTFTIELAGGRERAVFGKYEFHAVDVTKPIEQLLPIAKLSELVIDPSSINLRAKNNGDGTMSFIYTDTSIKPDYIIPWDWIEKDGDFLLFADWQITGHYARDPNAVAIGAKFTFATLYDDDTVGFGLIRSYYSPPLGVAWEDFNRWESITIHMEEAVSLGYNTVMAIIVDENGLTAKWTQGFEQGFSFDDIIVFGLDIHFDFSGRTGVHRFYQKEVSVWLEMSDIME